ncbi:MAG: type II toxin-antitoxin system RelE/ParE family toxin [Bacteroidetes bacterium]|nr:type II toxin-antitoxin system RelE/ParE family toxin [Bacteroidota bacterium]
MGVYKLSVAATIDLENVFEYGILQFGIQNALTYMEAMEKHFVLLSDNPELGRGAAALASGLRRFSYGSHSIFYLVIPKGILVVRVLHQSMDYEQHLP